MHNYNAGSTSKLYVACELLHEEMLRRQSMEHRSWIGKGNKQKKFRSHLEGADVSFVLKSISLEILGVLTDNWFMASSVTFQHILKEWASQDLFYIWLVWGQPKGGTPWNFRRKQLKLGHDKSDIVMFQLLPCVKHFRSLSTISWRIQLHVFVKY